ncbi:MAG: hypothetical protein IT160_00750 [Bryobacterales bacterium]|nr:hypothetical protein [Bryobacterales bacterium]
MSDYMFMLESHLSADQTRVVSQVQSAASGLGFALFLTGGAMRDMLGGFPINDLDFAVEGNALKLANELGENGTEVLEANEHRRTVELRFPGGVRGSVSSTRQERSIRSGAKLQIPRATIHEDLRSRDFTINAIALSLNRASRGLLLDPNNGLADLERRELRAISNYSFHDDPSRLIRLIRLRTRLHFTVAERTWQQYQNAREAGLELKITPAALMRELRSFASEPDVGELLKALDECGLMRLFSPALSGANLNIAAFIRLQKMYRMVPFGVDFPVDDFGLFLYTLTEKLSRGERTAMLNALDVPVEDRQAVRALPTRSAALEKQLASPQLSKPSLLFTVLSKSTPAAILFTLLHSSQRSTQDRIRNYLQKYLPASQEVTAAEVEAAAGAAPGTPKFERKQQELVAARLDARPKRAPEPAPEPEPAPVKPAGTPWGGRRGRRPSSSPGPV